MDIVITSGTGEGPTSLAAFDLALLQAGIGNYNVIQLSSVIPPNSNITTAEFHAPDAEYGHRLYVVMAHCKATVPGKEAWAGLGWVQKEDSKRGLFVEFEGISRDDVQQKIDATLNVMMAARQEEYGPIHSHITGIAYRDKPVSALVAAIYQSQGWDRER